MADLPEPSRLKNPCRTTEPESSGTVTNVLKGTSNPKVAGSIPARRANRNCYSAKGFKPLRGMGRS